MFVEAYYCGHVTTQTLPRHLYGQNTTGACLERGRVGGRGSTPLAIIEHNHFRMLFK